MAIENIAFHAWVIEPFIAFGFMRKALAGTLALSLGAAPIGVFLLLRRMSLMGDAMSHAILPGAALGYLSFGLSLWAMTLGGLVAGLAVVFAAGWVSRSSVLREDATLATFYLLSLAAGVMIVSLKGGHLDLLHVLFGSVLALDTPSLYLMAGVSSLSLMGLAILIRPLAMDCFEPGFLKRKSRWSGLAHYGFLILVVCNLVAAFHALGTLMAVGLMILPAASARLWTQNLTRLLGLSMGLALLASLAGLLVSFHADVPAGPAIVLAGGLVYLLSLGAAPQGLLRPHWPARKHLQS
jgi:zinc/manganese transport system permease protein